MAVRLIKNCAWPMAVRLKGVAYTQVFTVCPIQVGGGQQKHFQSLYVTETRDKHSMIGHYWYP